MQYLIHRTESWSKSCQSAKSDEQETLHASIQPPTRLTLSDLAEMVELVKRRLAWFGLEALRIGPVLKVREGAVVIELLHEDEVFCRIELDAQQGLTKFTTCEALRPLISTLQKHPTRRRGP
jgi:hypothetical protein